MKQNDKLKRLNLFQRIKRIENHLKSIKKLLTNDFEMKGELNLNKKGETVHKFKFV